MPALVTASRGQAKNPPIRAVFDINDPLLRGYTFGTISRQDELGCGVMERVHYHCNSIFIYTKQDPDVRKSHLVFGASCLRSVDKRRTSPPVVPVLSLPVRSFEDSCDFFHACFCIPKSWVPCVHDKTPPPWLPCPALSGHPSRRAWIPG